MSGLVESSKFIISQIFSDEIDDVEETPENREASRAIKRRLTRLLARTDVYFVHIGGGFGERIIRGRKMTSPLIARFPHSSGPMLFPRGETEIKQRGSGHDPVLVWDPDTGPYYRDAGMPKTIALGYHCLMPQWRALAREASHEIPSCAVVYSFQNRDDKLPTKEWKQLHQWTYAAIRKYFKNIPIYIKAHPNQDMELLSSFASTQGWENTVVTLQNPMVLAEKAEVCVSLLTLGIFTTLLLDIPSINAFNARKAYEAACGPMRQDYPSLGVPSAETQEELDMAVRSASRGEIANDFGSKKSQIPLVATLAQVVDEVKGWYASLPSTVA